MRLIQRVIISIFLISLYCSVSAQKGEEVPSSLMSSIEYDYFYKHLKYLSGDELGGRQTGSEGYDKAASYIAEEFFKNGMLPFGDSGTYYQRIAFFKPAIEKNSVTVQVEKKVRLLNGYFGKDITLLPNARSRNFNEKQKLAFVGFGNIIPEENINDYKGVDVNGKTVIVAIGGPRSIQHPAFEDILVKIHNAETMGASGIILFYPQGRLIQKMIFRYVHTFLNKSTLYYSDSSIRGSILDTKLKLCAYAKVSFIKEVFRLNEIHYSNVLSEINSGKNISQDLCVSIDCRYKTSIDPVSCKNVVSIVPGTDSLLRDEYVVLGAHLDHLGIGKVVKRDSIYNGMLDNASGCAALLCIGKAFSQLPEKPKRSIIFICYTAEEDGFFGSHYFVNRNEIRTGKIVANLNIDMVANLFETSGVFPIGYLHSNLSEAVDFAAEQLSLGITSNKSLDAAYLERGDQFSFIRKGIPGLFIIPGTTAVDPKIDGFRRTNRWLRKYYHSPHDDLHQEHSEEAFLTGIKMNLMTLYYMTNRMEKIEWVKGDWVKEKYSISKKNSN